MQVADANRLEDDAALRRDDYLQHILSQLTTDYAGKYHYLACILSRSLRGYTWKSSNADAIGGLGHENQNFRRYPHDEEIVWTASDQISVGERDCVAKKWLREYFFCAESRTIFITRLLRNFTVSHSSGQSSSSEDSKVESDDGKADVPVQRVLTSPKKKKGHSPLGTDTFHVGQRLYALRGANYWPASVLKVEVDDLKEKERMAIQENLLAKTGEEFQPSTSDVSSRNIGGLKRSLSVFSKIKSKLTADKIVDAGTAVGAQKCLNSLGLAWPDIQKIYEADPKAKIQKVTITVDFLNERSASGVDGVANSTEKFSYLWFDGDWEEKKAEDYDPKQLTFVRTTRALGFEQDSSMAGGNNNALKPAESNKRGKFFRRGSSTLLSGNAQNNNAQKSTISSFPAIFDLNYYPDADRVVSLLLLGAVEDDPAVKERVKRWFTDRFCLRSGGNGSDHWTFLMAKAACLERLRVLGDGLDGIYHEQSLGKSLGRLAQHFVNSRGERLEGRAIRMNYLMEAMGVNQQSESQTPNSKDPSCKEVFGAYFTDWLQQNADLIGGIKGEPQDPDALERCLAHLLVMVGSAVDPLYKDALDSVFVDEHDQTKHNSSAALNDTGLTRCSVTGIEGKGYLTGKEKSKEILASIKNDLVLSTMKRKKKDVKVKMAPVKTLSRMLNKIDSDYFTEKFPKTGLNCDVVRCGITAGSVEELESDLTKIVDEESCRRKSQYDGVVGREKFLEMALAQFLEQMCQTEEKAEKKESAWAMIDRLESAGQGDKVWEFLAGNDEALIQLQEVQDSKRGMSRVPSSPSFMRRPRNSSVDSVDSVKSNASSVSSLRSSLSRTTSAQSKKENLNHSSGTSLANTLRSSASKLKLTKSSSGAKIEQACEGPGEKGNKTMSSKVKSLFTRSNSRTDLTEKLPSRRSSVNSVGSQTSSFKANPANSSLRGTPMKRRSSSHATKVDSSVVTDKEKDVLRQLRAKLHQLRNEQQLRECLQLVRVKNGWIDDQKHRDSRAEKYHYASLMLIFVFSPMRPSSPKEDCEKVNCDTLVSPFLPELDCLSDEEIQRHYSEGLNESIKAGLEKMAKRTDSMLKPGEEDDDRIAAIKKQLLLVSRVRRLYNNSPGNSDVDNFKETPQERRPLLYSDLAAANLDKWEGYAANLEKQWDRTLAKAALEYLRSPDLAPESVRFVCEAQLQYKPYVIEGRLKTHLHYKVARAIDAVALREDFQTI